MSNIKFDTDRLNQIIQNTENAKSQGEPAAKDVSYFEKELREKDGGSQDSRQNDDDDSGTAPKNSPFDGIFQNPFSMVKESAKTAEVQTAPPAENDITEKMVEQILLSDPKDGEQEIRIRLSDAILKDTEIQLKRLNDGSLQILLTSGNASSVQTLVAQQFELKKRLEQIENTAVSVEVSTQDQDRNDTQQESRGLFDLYSYYKQN